MTLPAAADLLPRFRAAWPTERWRDERVLVAVSGGADSVALLRLLTAVRADVVGDGRLVVAHFNHRLRGAESEGDEQFVADLAGSLQLACELGRANSGQPVARDEESARAARYTFLQATCERIGARYLVTAHTADDQAETVLHHLMRGTGLAGLAGIPRVRALGEAVSLVRPLLDFRRQELRGYLEALGQSFRHDRSNDDPRYRRNRIRGEVLPLLNEVQGANVVEAIVRSARLAGEAQQAIDVCVEVLARDSVVVRSNCVALDTRRLRDQPDYLVRELIRRVWSEQGWPLQAMDAGHWQSLAEMAQAASDPVSPRDFPGQINAAREGDKLVLRKS